MNARGLSDVIKRRAIFNFYRSRTDILCIQEVHSTPDVEQIWANEWSGDVLFSHGTSNARGVAIFMPKGMMNSVENVKRDVSGRMLCCTIKIQDLKLSLCNIYAPNNDNPCFFEQIEKMIAEMSEHVIIIGDFNLVMNAAIDRLNSDHNKEKSLQVINNICEERYLVDIWRCRNETAKRFSWYRCRPKLMASRIDFALVSQGLAGMCENTGYVTGVKTDHLAYFLYLKLSNNDRGVGYWKLNVTYLKKPIFVQFVNKVIDDVLLETQSMGKIERWEYLKYKMRKEMKQYIKNDTQTIDLIIAQLSEKVSEMEESLQDCNLNLLEKSKEDLNEFLTQKAQACIFKSKARFAELGEKSTKYFFNLEKSRYNAKTCNAVFNDEGVLIRNTRGILGVQQKFYATLYKRDQNVKFEAINDTGIVVPPHLNKEDQFTESEIGVAVSGLPNGKTCGNDGLPIDMYKVFWARLRLPFMEMMKATYNVRHLHNSALIGVVNLIPKQLKDTRNLKFLRPITILNSDCKIIEKAIANRIQPVLDNIISDDQRGFRKNRRISANIRMLYELIKYAKDKDIQAILLSLDFEKCFDKIEFTALHGALDFFGFSEILKTWTKIIYTDFKVNILNNGHFSQRIDIERGLHQGGPCSSLYFLICAEILAIMLKKNEHIRGIPVEEMLNLLGQYADDADVYMLYDQRSYDSFFLIMERFKAMSGFTLNYDKMSILRIGALANSDASMFSLRQVAWTNNPIKALGVWITVNGNELEFNYKEIIDKSKSILEKWAKRKLSLHGKVLIINSMVASLFMYKMQVLPNMNSTMHGAIKQIVTNFLWNGAKPKISYEALTCSKTNGGLGLSDMELREKALKLAWAQILVNEPKLKNVVYANLNLGLGDYIWDCSLSRSDVKTFIGTDNLFWQHVMEAWFELKDKLVSEDPKSEIIWLNSRIHVEGKPIRWKKCIDAGLIYLGQLYQKGQIISFIKAKRLFRLGIMEYNAIIAAMPREWKSYFRTTEYSNFSVDEKTSFHARMCEKKNLVAYAYKVLNDRSVNIEDKLRKWEADLCCVIEKKIFMQCFKDIYATTNIPKLRSFQFRLLHRAIITNIHLNRWGKIESDSCTFCKEAPETYVHLFVYCRYVKAIWIELETWMEVEISAESITFGLDRVISNKIMDNAKHVKNTICLMLKQYIYRKRCFKEIPTFNEFKRMIVNNRNVERYNALKNDNMTKHIKKWNIDNASPSYIEDGYSDIQ